jgi:hypothetical protein
MNLAPLIYSLHHRSQFNRLPGVADIGQEAAEGHPTRRRLLRVLRDVLLIGLLTFALGEVVLRFVHHFHPGFIFFSDSYNRFRREPFSWDYSFRINSHGFKDVEFEVAKGGAYRIIGIGDSFAVGVVPYEDNYLTLVEEDLRRSGWDVELFNMGIPNIGPKEYSALLMAEGLELDPDMVLLSFFVGNDFLESVRVIERSAVDYSYVVSLLRYAFIIRPQLKKNIPEGPWEYDDTSPTVTSETFLKIERWRSRICFQSPKSFTVLLDSAVGKLDEISKICRRRNIALVVVVIPDEFQVSPKLQDAIFESRKKPREESAVDFARPNQMLARELDALGIEYLDLLPAFADAGQRARYYKLRDTHWNIAGNQLAAELIAEYLLSRRLPR